MFSYYLLLCVCLRYILFCCDTECLSSHRLVSPEVFILFLFCFILFPFYLTCAVSDILLSSYYHFSCMGVGVLYLCVHASIEKHFVILSFLFTEKKINFFCVEIIVWFYDFPFLTCLHLFMLSPFPSADLIMQRFLFF